MSIAEDLVGLICSSFASDHLFNLSICKVQSVSRSEIVDFVDTKQVSSANRFVLQDKAFGRSLTYMRKRRGPSSDGIQNFKNRFSFVSYFLTTGSFIKV